MASRPQPRGGCVGYDFKKYGADVFYTWTQDIRAVNTCIMVDGRLVFVQMGSGACSSWSGGQSEGFVRLFDEVARHVAGQWPWTPSPSARPRAWT